MSLLNASPNNARSVYTFLVVLGIISVLLGGWNMGRISYEYYLHLKDADSYQISSSSSIKSHH
ncbi:MAG: hypothetical protein FI734_08145 [SAR202 cluster bacterium]|nr:hypothetical protein [SAR202 cluster bacterium]